LIRDHERADDGDCLVGGPRVFKVGSRHEAK
jgi:hypothetical protein